MLVKRGAGRTEAGIIIRAALRPETRCAVCGIPEGVMQDYARRRIPAPCFHQNRQHMEIDRVTPGGVYAFSNIRPACPKCNVDRGAAIRTDEELRARRQREWESTFSPAELWWLRRPTVLGGGESEVPVHYREPVVRRVRTLASR